jgi:hypothetical protein
MPYYPFRMMSIHTHMYFICNAYLGILCHKLRDAKKLLKIALAFSHIAKIQCMPYLALHLVPGHKFPLVDSVADVPVSPHQRFLLQLVWRVFQTTQVDELFPFLDSLAI